MFGVWRGRAGSDVVWEARLGRRQSKGGPEDGFLVKTGNGLAFQGQVVMANAAKGLDTSSHLRLGFAVVRRVGTRVNLHSLGAKFKGKTENSGIRINYHFFLPFFFFTKIEFTNDKIHPFRASTAVGICRPTSVCSRP